MATAGRYSGYSSTWTYGAAQTLTLNQMNDVSVQVGTNRTEITPSGAVDLAAVIVGSGDPMINFGTYDLSTLLGQVSLTAGLALTGTGTVQFQRREDLAVFSSGSTHDSITCTAGWMGLNSITASQDDTTGAKADCSVHVLYDGTNNPLVHNTSVALAGTPGFSSYFYLGPVTINSTEVEGITSVRVSTGLSFSRRRVSGQVWATKGAIVQRRPVIEITALEVSDFATLAMHGRALAGTVNVFFRKGTASGTRVADATTEHVKVSATAGYWQDDSISVQQNDDGTVTCTILPTTTLSLSTASAIS